MSIPETEDKDNKLLSEPHSHYTEQMYQVMIHQLPNHIKTNININSKIQI